MIDSSIFLKIIKHEEPSNISCEEKLNEIKKKGKAFSTYTGIAEVYRVILEFIEEEAKKISCKTIDAENRLKIKMIEEILNVTKEVFKDVVIVEITEDALKKIYDLFSLKEKLRMGSRDRVILGTAESNFFNQFLFIDKRIEGDGKTIREIGFKIELCSL